MSTWTRYSPEPTNGRMDPMDVINSPAFGPAVMRAIQDPRIAGYLVPRSIPQRAVDIPLVTDLPVAPQDGDEVYLLVDPEYGRVWHFRYRDKVSSAYRWEAVGAQTPLYSEVQTQETTTSTSYTALSTAGPSVTLPLPGDWLVSIGGNIQAAASSGNMSAVMSYDIGSTAAVDGDSCSVYGPNPVEAGVTRTRMKIATPAVALTAKYKIGTGAGAAYFSHRWMTATPIRVGRT